MRKFWLATSAAALALNLTGYAIAEPDAASVKSTAAPPATTVAPAATTVAPPQATTSQGLMFSKDAPAAKPIEQPAAQSTPQQQTDQPAAAQVQPADAQA